MSNTTSQYTSGVSSTGQAHPSTSLQAHITSVQHKILGCDTRYRGTSLKRNRDPLGPAGGEGSGCTGESREAGVPWRGARGRAGLRRSLNPRGHPPCGGGVRGVGVRVLGFVDDAYQLLCRDTSLIRNHLALGPYSRPMPRALWWS